MELTEREKKVLACIALRASPVPLPYHLPEVQGLINKGALEQGWQASEAGRDALRNDPDLSWIVPA